MDHTCAVSQAKDYSTQSLYCYCFVKGGCKLIIDIVLIAKALLFIIFRCRDRHWYIISFFVRRVAVSVHGWIATRRRCDDTKLFWHCVASLRQRTSFVERKSNPSVNLLEPRPKLLNALCMRIYIKFLRCARIRTSPHRFRPCRCSKSFWKSSR